MADPMIALRRPPLGGAQGGSSAASVAVAHPATRLSLRAKADAVEALSSALGIQLPMKPKTSVSANVRHALWIGPDEWLVIDESEADLMAAAANAGVLHSATDVSHRNTAFVVTGPGAAEAINGGCPLDLSSSAFPVRACARTVLGKIEVVVLRTAEHVYRVECWRSFAPYAFGMLVESAEDLGH